MNLYPAVSGNRSGQHSHMRAEFENPEEPTMPRHSLRPTAGRRKALTQDDRDLSARAPIAAPATLTSAERVVWDTLAPAAERMRTLVHESIPGFVLLCQTLVQRDDAWARLAAEGLTVTTPSGEVKAHPLTTHARQLGQRAESLMARYALTAPGRPVERPRVPVDDAVSKWERLTRRPEAESDYDSYSE